MSLPKRTRATLLSLCALLGLTAANLPSIGLAQSNPGLTIFSGLENRGDLLSYHLDFGGQSNGRDRYRLRIPSKKVELGVAQIAISYPNYYYGSFDTRAVEVKYGEKYSKTAPVSEVVWDRDRRVLQIYLQQPIEARNKIEIRLSNVTNPNFGGTFYFNCRVMSPGDIPLPRYVGTWIISIE